MPSAAGPAAALGLKTRSALMSGDMDLATTTAAGAAQNAAAQAQSLAAAAAAPAGGEFICPRCNVGVGSKETEGMFWQVL